MLPEVMIELDKFGWNTIRTLTIFLKVTSKHNEKLPSVNYLSASINIDPIIDNHSKSGCGSDSFGLGMSKTALFNRSVGQLNKPNNFFKLKLSIRMLISYSSPSLL